ncbi:hypothetical protein [Streptomyces sp. NPDC018045]|uniref:hypothetical protein n=1 Tax=Streptomyces sp. NPDC018045 TaxID=3365037 RepID=UPI0037AA7196
MARHIHLAARNPLRRWSVAVVAALAALAVNVTVAAPAAQAVDNDGTSPFATYNMHGSDNDLTWRSEIESLAANHAAVALQEVGAGPLCR